MAYFLLALALAGGLAKGLSGKRVSRDVGSLQDSFAATLIPSFFSAIIGLLVAAISLVASGAGLSGFILTPRALLICLASSFFDDQRLHTAYGKFASSASDPSKSASESKFMCALISKKNCFITSAAGPYI